jgi:hypothetical protein
MKTLTIILSSAAAQSAAVAANGSGFDAPTVLSIAAASCIAAMFASDYRQSPDYNLHTHIAPTPVSSRMGNRAHCVTAPFIIFETTAA